MHGERLVDDFSESFLWSSRKPPTSRLDVLVVTWVSSNTIIVALMPHSEYSEKSVVTTHFNKLSITTLSSLRYITKDIP